MVKILVDTTAGLSREYLAAHQLPLLPQIVVFGEDSYRDDTELDTQTFLKKLRESAVLPKTAAPPPALYTPIYRRLLDEGHSILVITPSADVSGTARSAEVAAQDFPGADIRVMDTRVLAGPMATMIEQAVQWAEAGDDIDTIVARLEAMIPRVRIYFVVATLEYLHKGGRIGGAQAIVGSLLQIKPILTIQNGRVEAMETQRTQARAMKRIIDLTLRDCQPGQQCYLSVMHADAEAEALRLAQYFKEALDLDDIPIYELPPAVVVHAGPGIVAVSYFVEAK